MKNLFTLIILLLSLFVVPAMAQSGYLDTTFGDQGIVIRDLGGSEVAANAVIQHDDKILLISTAGSAQNRDFALLRYLKDGTRDMDFYNNGLLLVDVAGTGDRGSAIALQSDQKILLAGESQINGSPDFAVVRLQPDGYVDTTFGNAGKVTVDVGTGFEYLNDIGVQEDGKIILAGRVESKTFSDYAMVRLLPDGTLDEDFGSGGIVVTSLRDEDEARELIIQPDGKLVLGGYTSISAQGDYGIVRYNADGTLDKTFGEGGKVITDIEGGSDLAFSIVLTNDGGIVAGGIANFFPFGFSSDITLVKYLPDGSMDSLFGDNGIAIIREGESNFVYSIALQPDGKILMAGNTDHPDGETRIMLLRFLPDGTLDSIFGTNGFVTTAITGIAEYGSKVMIARDSRIIVAGGTTIGASADIVMTRYIADFILDVTVFPNTCFGVNDGALQINVTGGAPPFLYSLNGGPFQASFFFQDLDAGTFDITVCDSRGVCATYTLIEIPSTPVPPVVTVEVLENQITIDVEGDPQGFLFSIDGSAFSSLQVFPGLPNGLYLVEVLDQNGCLIFTSEVTINTTSILSLNDQISFSITPNPGNGIFFLHSKESISTGALSVFDLTGRLISRLDLNSNSYSSGNVDLSFLSTGMYQVLLQSDDKWGMQRVVINR